MGVLRAMAEHTDAEKFAEAENYHLQATFILHKLQANNSVYGTNSAWSCPDPADIELALKYLDRSLEHIPDSSAYLNTKSLILIESGHNRELGLKLMERAAQLDPRDITIQDNLEKLRSSQNSGCFIATAAYGSAQTWQVEQLKRWRDRRLANTAAGRLLVRIYYRVSPPLAELVRRNPRLRAIVKSALNKIVSRIEE